jgi:hypothetical protein
VKNLSHSASFHSVEKTAPSKPGIKHLGNGGPVRANSIAVRPSCLQRKTWMSAAKLTAGYCL